MLIEHDAQMRPLEQLGEQCLAPLDRFAPQVAAVQLKQIERAMHGAGERAVAPDQVKNRKAALVADDGLAINQAGANRQLADRGRDKREA